MGKGNKKTKRMRGSFIVRVRKSEREGLGYYELRDGRRVFKVYTAVVTGPRVFGAVVERMDMRRSGRKNPDDGRIPEWMEFGTEF